MVGVDEDVCVALCRQQQRNVDASFILDVFVT